MTVNLPAETTQFDTQHYLSDLYSGIIFAVFFIKGGYLGEENMKPSVLTFILSGSILLLCVNVYSLNLSNHFDKYSLTTYSFPFAKKKYNNHIKFASHSKTPVSFSLIKPNNPCGFIDTFNQSWKNFSNRFVCLQNGRIC